MDNVVQNISIADIIPGKFHPSKEEKQKIEEIATLIKLFGLLDPILVRPKDGKYEIVSGMDKYQAALIANQNIIPVIIKKEDDETYSEYSNINKKQDISLTSLPTETFSKIEKNSDIINLSELSKIKLEYERDDVKMNNEQFNNNMINTNFNQQNLNQANPAPTFGGRFFPSLEDEPTNMNMMSNINPQPSTPVTPILNTNEPNNNLIDLTDMTVEKEAPITQQPNFGTPMMNIPTFEQPQNINQTQSMDNNNNIPNLAQGPIQPTDNIINLESLQHNNPAVKPIIEPPIEPVVEPISMDILNADFGAPNSIQSPINMTPNIDLNMPTNPVITEQPMPAPVEKPNIIPSEFNINQPIPTPEIAPVIPNLDINPIPTMQSNYNNVEESQVSEVVQPLKDVTPVTKTIRNLVSSLEEFGYKINITEEDLPNTSKITIEVEK